MLLENEARLRALIKDDAAADQILEIIQQDEAARRADLVRRQSEGLQSARERGVRLGGPPAKKPRKFQSVYTMAKTIAALRASGHDCKVWVGGAVMTPEYAREIGADYYARDAKASVDIAKEVLG